MFKRACPCLGRRIVSPRLMPLSLPRAVIYNPSMDPGEPLERRLGPYTASMIVVGSMIGSGIFKKPALMAEQLGSAGPLLLVWLIAGAVTLFGALSNAEIAGMIPAVGGQYVFFRRIYNRFLAYLYGWSVFAVIQTGSIASIAYVFAEYLGYFVDLPRLPSEWESLGVNLFGVIDVAPFAHVGVKLLTVACIAALTTANILGVVFGGAIQSVLTTLKVLAIGIIVVLAFSVGDGSLGHLTSGGPGLATTLPFGAVGAVLAATSGAFWSYDGWNNITFVAGEIRAPNRSIPTALISGTAVVVLVYMLINAAYLYVLPVERMAGSSLVAADAMRQILGPTGGALISGLVMLSTFGTANGSILASARVHYAVARDGLFFGPLGRTHPRFQTPACSLLVQGIWASLLVFSGTFDQLTDMLIFVSWIFYLLGALGVFILRVREPDTERPYRVWGYPVVPSVFCLFAAVFVVVTMIQNTRNALLGLLLVALGGPLYLWRR